MNSPVLLFIIICGVLYGFISLFIELKRKSKMSKNQLGLSMAIIIAGIASFLIAMN